MSGVAVGFIDKRDEVDYMMDFSSRPFGAVLSKPKPLEEESGKGHGGHMVRFIRNLIATRRGTSGINNFGDNADESRCIGVNSSPFDVFSLVKVEKSVLTGANRTVFAGPEQFPFVLQVQNGLLGIMKKQAFFVMEGLGGLELRM